MNAAEKARLAKEKEEQERQSKTEQRRRKISDFFEYTGGWILLVLTGLCALGTVIFAYLAMIGSLDEGMRFWAWMLILLDVVVIIVDALHAKWSGTMLVIDEGVGVYATFIGAVFLSVVVLLIKSIF